MIVSVSQKAMKEDLLDLEDHVTGLKEATSKNASAISSMETAQRQMMAKTTDVSQQLETLKTDQDAKEHTMADIIERNQSLLMESLNKINLQNDQRVEESGKLKDNIASLKVAADLAANHKRERDERI